MSITAVGDSLPAHLLTVSEVPFEEWSTILVVAKEWRSIAIEKYAETGDLTGLIFDNSVYVLHKITQTIKETEDVAWKKQLFICRDGSSRIQGMAFFSPNSSYLNQIASHPENLSHPINDLAKRVRGVGTTMIVHFAKMAYAKQQPLTLVSLLTADAFYKSLGFVRVEDKFLLTCEKIEGIISRKL
jgi:hypothetical protein